MKLKLTKEFKEFMELFGAEVPYNVTSVYHMLETWKCNDVNKIPVMLAQKNLAATTYANRCNILKKFITYLLSRKKIKNDPFVGTFKPKLRRQPYKDRRKPFTDDEIVKILAAFKDQPKYYNYIMFLLLTGVRVSEAIGLQVCKVNFEQHTILINASMGRVIASSKNFREKGYKLKGTKTENERYLYLTEQLEELLRPLCERKKPEDFVFKGPRNTKLENHNFVRRVFKPMLKSLGIPERDLYAMRHTFGTICIEQGIDPLTTGHLMGHVNARTVVQHYAHKRQIVTIMPTIKIN